MSTAEPETLQNPQGLSTELESGTAEWAFPEIQLSSDPAPDAVYGALPDSSWFRLLIVQPSKKMWAPLRCQLRVFKRRDAHGKYEALSYAWREGEQSSEFFWKPATEKDGKWRPQQIVCNGHKVSIKGNLGCALIHIRHSSRPRAIWVDALCINQADPMEIAAQIQTMPDIYGHARRTIVWLGMSHPSKRSVVSNTLSLPHPEAAVASVCHLVKHWDPSQPVRYFTTDPKTRFAEAKEPDLGCGFARNLSHYFRSPRNGWETDLLPLKEFFGATWFTRKWVIQEVALSRSVDVLFHNCRVSWRWVGLAAAIIRMQYDNALREHRMYNVYNAYLMFRLSGKHGLDPARMTFVELLRLTAAFETSEPRDVFYSLLGLETTDHHPERGPLIQPDHQASYEDICISLARTILGRAGQCGSNPLAILMDAGIAEDPKRKVPSWVPTWQPGKPGLLSPWSLDDCFTASKGLDVHVDTSSPLHLTVQGIHVSNVQWVSPYVMASEDDIALTIDWLRTFSFTDPITSSHLKVYSRTLCAGRDVHGRREKNRKAMMLPFIAFAIYGVLPNTELFRWINTGYRSLPKAQKYSLCLDESSESENGWSGEVRWSAEWKEGRMRFGHAASLAGRGAGLFLRRTDTLVWGPARPSPVIWS
ncbi:Heterokaryon incompatibility protein 6, OR allele, partial [Madurella mycetomatis]